MAVAMVSGNPEKRARRVGFLLEAVLQNIQKLDNGHPDFEREDFCLTKGRYSG